MGITEELDDLRASLPACRFIVLADLSSRMVLCASAEIPLPQENYDALCINAADLFSSPAYSLALRELGAKDGDGAEAILADASGTQVYVFSTRSSDDALCFQCGPEVDLVSLIAAARPVVDRIAGDQE